MSAKPTLQIRFSFKNLAVFMFFFFLMHELHELAHIITGRIICGCWGNRDFNVWDVCPGCLQQHPLAIAATFAGPVFTFAMLWMGRYWLKHSGPAAYRSLGLVLILGNMQFGRMYMAATGSGDEVWGLRYLFLNPDHSNLLLIKIAAFLIVSVICIPPLATAYRAIANKNKVLIFAAFLIIPLMLDTVIILMVLNGILAKGIWSSVWIMGTPLLITAWLAVCAVIVLVNVRSLSHFAAKMHAASS